MKRCPHCGQTKPLDEFHWRRARAGRREGPASWCKVCQREQVRAYQRENRELVNRKQRESNRRNAARRRAYALKSTYGLTVVELDRLLERQGGGCAICGRPQNGKALNVDHDHRCCPGRGSCGRCVRGLLCLTCNHLLGNAEDDPERLARAIAYLARPPATA